MKNMPRPGTNFIGVFIPNEIVGSNRLSLLEKTIFIGMCALAFGDKRECFPTNSYLAEFIGMSPRRVSALIASLKRKGFVTTTIKNHNQRVIQVAEKYALVLKELNQKK